MQLHSDDQRDMHLLSQLNFHMPFMQDKTRQIVTIAIILQESVKQQEFLPEAFVMNCHFLVRNGTRSGATEIAKIIEAFRREKAS